MLVASLHPGGSDGDGNDDTHPQDQAPNPGVRARRQGLVGAHGAGYTFSAPTRFDKLFTGIVSPRPAFVAAGDTRGLGHLTPGDTGDQDYGELLERVCGKGLASPTGFEPVFWP